MPDSATVLHDHAYQGASVLANDTDTGPGPLTATMFTGTSHGTVLVNSDGTYSYTPAAGYIGADQFTYQATDGANSDSTTVSITVYDNAPTANSFAASGVQNSSISLPVPANVSDPDGDPLTTVVVTPPQYGMAFANSDGTISYVPSPGFTGTDSVTYQVNDGAMNGNTATVTINVLAPVATDDTFAVSVTDPLNSTTLDVTANDTNPTGYSLVPVIVQYPQNGMASVSNGKIVYTPNLGFAGTDTFTYFDSAGSAMSNIATVTLDDQVQPPGLVINLNDTGADTGSLRAAIIAVNAGMNSLVVARSAAAGTAYRIFTIQAGQCIISGLNIVNGTVGTGQNGGGIYNAASLTLNNVDIDHNQIAIGQRAALEGGGIYNAAGATLSVNNCQIWENSANKGGGIANYGTAFVSGTTQISLNSVDFDGGGSACSSGGRTVYGMRSTCASRCSRACSPKFDKNREKPPTRFGEDPHLIWYILGLIR